MEPKEPLVFELSAAIAQAKADPERAQRGWSSVVLHKTSSLRLVVISLTAGSLLALDAGIEHAVKAVSECVFLLTLAGSA